MGKILSFVFLVVLVVLIDSASIIKETPNENKSLAPDFIDLSGDGKYLARWVVDSDTQSITFEVIVETTGYVGFGISPGTTMTGADLIIGGVGVGGVNYFDDRHATGPSAPPKDISQDWDLLDASETLTHTTLTFRRLLNTLDTDQDIEITDRVVSLIWSIGTTDSMEHHANRGARAINFLEPLPELETSPNPTEVSYFTESESPETTTENPEPKSTTERSESESTSKNVEPTTHESTSKKVESTIHESTSKEVEPTTHESTSKKVEPTTHESTSTPTSSSSTIRAGFLVTLVFFML